MARPRKSVRAPRVRPSLHAVLNDPEAHPERNRRLGGNLFLAFVVFWVVMGGAEIVIRVMAGR